MIDAKDLARSGCKYLGTPYSTMDCQKLWERMLLDCGIDKDLGGSNSWYRYMMEHGWVGTPEECKQKYGCIPQGATLYIREDVSSKTPEQFRHDGIGDITHMGCYTAMTGQEMVNIAIQEGDTKAPNYNFGDGAIHSSHSKGAVCTSKFAGKTIPNGGWNRVGLWPEQINYSGSPVPPTPPEPPTPEPDKAIVFSEDGNPVKMRAKPSSKCSLYWKVPVGTILDVLEWGDGWSKVQGDTEDGYKTGYMMNTFLKPVENPEPSGGMYTVHIPNLTQEQAQALVKQYPDSWMTEQNAVG